MTISYATGTVISYDDHAGYGYVTPDEESFEGERLLVHRRSLRDCTTVLAPGDRVRYREREVPRGKLASDVRLIAESDESGFSQSESATGRIASTHYERAYGFIETTDKRRVFFHVSRLWDPRARPEPGVQVVCSIVESPRGLQAQEVALLEAGDPAISEDVAPTSQDLLAKAALAREEKRFDEAVHFFEQGMSGRPTVQLVLSYAAMERRRGHREHAMKVYERGIKRLPRVSKLHEDAGILAEAMGQFSRSQELLLEALRLCRTTNQAGEKGVLLALARTNYRRGTQQALKAAVEYYTEALKLFGKGTQPPAKDLSQLSLARIRTQHYRGNLTATFLRGVGFDIRRAELLPKMTVGGDLVVETNDAEFRESYGIAGQLLVRCMFKGTVSQRDLKELDARAEQLSRTGLVDAHVVLLVVASVSEALQRVLFRRIEGHQRAIVPVPQSVIETEEDARTAIRLVLDQWLYRRDLFAAGFPVVGRRFFGRDKPLADLRDAIATGTPCGIFGLRKVGKTSLLKEVERRATEGGDVVVYMDLLRVPEGISDTRWLYWRLGDLLRERSTSLGLGQFKWRLGGVFEDYFDLGADFPVSTAFDADLTKLLREVGASRTNPRPKVVLLFDEIERLLPSRLGKPGFKGFFGFFSYLRGVSQETKDFVVLVTGANPAVNEAAQFAERDNPVFNFFKEVYLQLLEDTECALMMRTLGRGMGIRFEPEAIQHVFELTGGHPFFARQLCSFVARRYRGRPLRVSQDMIEDLLDHYLERAGKDFAEIMARLSRDYPSERDLCLKLAETNGPIPLDQIAAEGLSVRHLEGYQIVQIQEGEVDLTMALMRIWLRRKFVNEG